jgi:hypothetical protein
MFTLTILLCLFFFSSLVRGLPTALSRDVVDPPITSPTTSTVWHSGETVTVTWDTSNIPPASQLTNPTGMVVLGYIDNPADGEHLMLNPPLASNFSITAGSVSFTVPSVITRSDYIVALFGDSGNISPTFTIQGTDASSSASPTTPSSTVSAPLTSSTTSASASETVTSGPPTSTSASEVSVTDTHTNTISVSVSSSVSPSPSLSGSVSAASTASGISQSSGSSAAGSSSATSSSASTSASALAASSNAGAKTGSHQSQFYALAAAGLLATYLL